MKKFFAFTLAEVLITLGIIGIVAAMTIPTLIQKHEEKVTVAKVKKMYSTLSQAYLMNKAQDEILLANSQSYGDDSAAEIAQIFLPYLKIAKDCGTTESGCMYTGVYSRLNGTSQEKYDVGGLSAYRVLLSDGSSVWFRRANSSNNYGGFYNYIMLDINGPNKPNTWGKDAFQFQIVNDMVLPFGHKDSQVPFDGNCSNTTSNSSSCTAWVVYKGNMNYLYCDDLSWDGKQKCD